ncbi:unnamed protein product [Triticum turgidum subsp. durum]|uniref:BED-type domain-containing protein n=1 Tax=Triticum turgidum subsp. durum TaxID=4567 RepID=A0A9R0TSG3_TRITD|nr:unnamed protein product [Triticum turgidum subsp. durum]
MNTDSVVIEEDIKEDEAQEEENEAEEVVVRPRRKLTPPVWKEFKKVKVKNMMKAKCNWCSKKLGGETRNGTKHLLDHLKICPYRKRPADTKKQTSLRYSSNVQGGKVAVENYTFDQDVARKALGSMFLLHDYPLSIVDHIGFRKFVSALQPLFKMVRRNTIRSDILDSYKIEKKRAINYMEKNKSRVAITTDMWTSEHQKRGYMAITAHFVDESWKLQSYIMRFIYVPGPHTTRVIAEILHDALVEWYLEDKVSTLTVDNATTNDACIPILENLIGPSKLMLGGKLLHMRCCAHILNLIVKDGLDVLEESVEKIRDSVAFWTSTPKRIENFQEVAKMLKVDQSKKLSLDVKTRWNSTYFMLSVALRYKSVFNRLRQREKTFTCAPSDDDWKFCGEVCDRLKLFADITEIFSGTQYVTANIYFPKICEIKMNIRKWSKCGNEIIEAMSDAMSAKFDKYWSDIQGLMGIATLLDPRFKIDMLHVCFEMLLGDESIIDCESKVHEIHELVSSLMLEYQMESEQENTEAQSVSISVMEANEVMSIFSARVARKRPATSLSRTELDRYLDDEYVPANQENFDVLGWWNVAGSRYPTLRAIARDIFAIPVTTVASESAFSRSGRVLSEHRSRLTPDLLEALMCSQNWERNKAKDDEKTEAASFWSCLDDIQ